MCVRAGGGGSAKKSARVFLADTTSGSCKKKMRNTNRGEISFYEQLKMPGQPRYRRVLNCVRTEEFNSAYTTSAAAAAEISM